MRRPLPETRGAPLSACQKLLDRLWRGLREHPVATDGDSCLPKQLHRRLGHGSDNGDTVQYDRSLDREVLLPRQEQHRQTAGRNDYLGPFANQRQDLAAELFLDLLVDILLLKCLHVGVHLCVDSPDTDRALAQAEADDLVAMPGYENGVDGHQAKRAAQ